mgnify:CR=1 FL=1
MVKVRIRSGVITDRGSHRSGEEIEFPEAQARHLVEIGAAEWIGPAPDPEPEPEPVSLVLDDRRYPERGARGENVGEFIERFESNRGCKHD